MLGFVLCSHLDLAQHCQGLYDQSILCLDGVIWPEYDLPTLNPEDCIKVWLLVYILGEASA